MGAHRYVRCGFENWGPDAIREAVLEEKRAVVYPVIPTVLWAAFLGAALVFGWVELYHLLAVTVAGVAL